MGPKKTTTTNQQSQERSSTSVGQATERETGIQDLLMQLAGNTASQFGDISNLAAGDMMNLDEGTTQQINALFNSQADASRRQASTDYKDTIYNTQDYFAKRGVADSSMERMGQGQAAQGYRNTLADIEGQRTQGIAGANLSLPFQIAQQQIGANQMLGSQIPGFTNVLMNNFLQRSLGNRTTEGTSSGTGAQETEGFTFGELAQLLGAAGSIKNG